MDVWGLLNLDPKAGNSFSGESFNCFHILAWLAVKESGIVRRRFWFPAGAIRSWRLLITIG
jgi:hypothetical protein